ncbi:hypothetical protein PG984_014745 [Apiospora sp. TS-2023a]
MADDPRYSQLKMAAKVVIFLNTPQNQTHMAPWAPLLTHIAATSLQFEPQLLRGVEKWLQGNASSLQKVALAFRERCSKLRILSIYNSMGAVHLGSGDELTGIFTTGFKREKTLDIKGYDYHSTPKPANKDDELLKLLAKEVKSQLRLASKLDNPAATGPDTNKSGIANGKPGILGSQPDNKSVSNAVNSRGREKQIINNVTQIVSVQNQQTSFQNQQFGPESVLAPKRTGPMPQSGASSKPPVSRPPPDTRPVSNAPNSKGPDS